MATLSMTQQCLGMEDGFPKNGSTEEKLRFLVQYAILSPSVRNSQPWKFTVEKGAINLFLDRSHAKRTSDPDLRELTISCGAALSHLCIAARKFGYEVVVERFPKGGAVDLLATVRLDGKRPPDEIDTVMFYAIHKWLNVPKPLRTTKRVPAELLKELERMGNSSPTWLHMGRTEKSRDTLAGIFALGDEIQRKAAESAGKSSTAETKRRMKDRSSVLKMDVGVGAGHLSNYIKSFFMRAPGEDTVLRSKKTELEKTEPVLAVLGTAANTQEAWLAAGERLGELLLRAMATGVRCSLLNQPVDQPEIREKLRKSLEISGFPQVFFRLGFPDVHGESGAGSGISEQLL